MHLVKRLDEEDLQKADGSVYIMEELCMDFRVFLHGNKLNLIFP